MKKIILLLTVFITSVSFAQGLDKDGLEVGRAQQFGAPIEAQLTIKDKVYKISFRDSHFKTLDRYESFEFSENDNNLETLYAEIEKGFETMPKELVAVPFASKKVYLKFDKLLGAKVLIFCTTLTDARDSEMIVGNFIAKKQVEKLFNKKKK